LPNGPPIVGCAAITDAASKAVCISLSLLVVCSPLFARHCLLALESVARFSAATTEVIQQVKCHPVSSARCSAISYLARAGGGSGTFLMVSFRSGTIEGGIVLSWEKSVSIFSENFARSLTLTWEP
jgi:hypothetical protein